MNTWIYLYPPPPTLARSHYLDITSALDTGLSPHVYTT